MSYGCPNCQILIGKVSEETLGLRGIVVMGWVGGITSANQVVIMLLGEGGHSSNYLRRAPIPFATGVFWGWTCTPMHYAYLVLERILKYCFFQATLAKKSLMQPQNKRHCNDQKN